MRVLLLAVVGVVARFSSLEAQPILERDGAEAMSSDEPESTDTPALGVAIDTPKTLDIEVGVRLFSRRLSYRDDIFDALSGYDLPLRESYVVSASAFPLARFGVAGRFAVTPTFDTGTSKSDATFSTDSRAFSVGVRGRQRVSKVELVGALDFGEHRFIINDSDDDEPAIPSVRYRYLRGGAAVNLPLTPSITAAASVGFRWVFAAGEIRTNAFFPNASVNGGDAAVRIDYALLSGVRVRLTFDAVRYFYQLDPKLGDPFIAGGAIDQHVGALIGVVYQR